MLDLASQKATPRLSRRRGRQREAPQRQHRQQTRRVRVLAAPIPHPSIKYLTRKKRAACRLDPHLRYEKEWRFCQVLHLRRETCRYLRFSKPLVQAYPSVLREKIPDLNEKHPQRRRPRAPKRPKARCATPFLPERWLSGRSCVSLGVFSGAGPLPLFFAAAASVCPCEGSLAVQQSRPAQSSPFAHSQSVLANDISREIDPLFLFAYASTFISKCRTVSQSTEKAHPPPSVPDPPKRTYI